MTANAFTMATGERLPAIDHAGRGHAPSPTADRQTEPEVNPDEEDVQVIPLDIDKPRGGRYSAWSQGKRNFTRVALKVLTNIYDKKLSSNETDANRNEADSQPMDSEQPRRIPKVAQSALAKLVESAVPPKAVVVPTRVLVQKRSISRVSAPANTRTSVSTTPNRKPKDTALRQKTNIASVMSVVAFRKIYMSKLMALSAEPRADLDRNGEQSKEDDEVLQEKEDLLPITPRFSSKLSPEAQFAMLKGYEDKLICDLKSAYPDKEKTMVRVRTPPQGRSIRVSDTGGGGSRSGSKIRSNSRSLHQEGDEATSSLSHPAYAAYDQREMRYHSQCKVTGQVETAIDILDHLRRNSGCHIISPRVRIGQKLEPVATYNAWTHQWAQQFKIRKAHYKT